MEMNNSEGVFCGISKRAMNVINAMNITTLEELSRVSDEKLLQHRNCSKHTINEIHWYLDTFFYNQ